MNLRFAALGLAALCGGAFLPVTPAHGQENSALLDALVKKGVLSDQEAEDVRASAAKDFAQTAAGKLQLSDMVKSITFYGDARLRYEYLDERPQEPGFGGAAGAALGHNASTTDRARYRLRVGVDYTYSDHLSGGFELESAQGADTANQSFGTEFEKFPINVGLVFIRWMPTDWLTLVGGKQHNPFYTTDLVWDPDINPEGASEALLFHPTDKLSIGLTAGQFDYADNVDFTNTSSGAGGTPLVNKTDVWMFEEQVPIQYNITKDFYVKEVPGFISYMGGGNAAAAGVNGASVNFTSPHATDNLQIFNAPGEVDWKVGDLPMRAYWDVAINTEAKDRIQNVYLGNGNLNTPGATVVQNQNRDLGDNVAWLAGLQVGQNKKKGDWSVRGDFRQIGLGAVDPNINDSDFGDSYLNQQGVRVQGIYNFTDFLQGSLTFFDTWALKNNLLNGTGGQTAAAVPLGGAAGSGATIGGTGSAETASLVGAHSTQRVQVDLLWKF